MNGSIAHYSRKYKTFAARFGGIALYVGSLILAILLGFQLGQNTSSRGATGTGTSTPADMPPPEISVGTLDLETLPASAYAAYQAAQEEELAAEHAADGGARSGSSSTLGGAEQGSSAQTAGNGVVVASKSGTKYYLPTCSGVNRIKEENKVFYQSAAEARAAGLTPAANCPGLE